MSNIVVAVSSTTVFLGTQRVHINQGTAWAAKSPAVTAHPELFTADPKYALGLDLEPPASAPVESKTAAPGEKSSARRVVGGKRDQ